MSKGRRTRFLLAAMVAVLCATPAGVQAAGRCGSHPWCDTSLSPDKRADLLLAALTDDEKISLLAGDDPFGLASSSTQHAGTSRGIARVDLPDMYLTDGPAGVRQGPATAMPSPMALAASFDRGLAGRYGSLVGNEAKSKGNDVVFAPTVNIMRTPLWGRTFETYGEDPYLTARIAAPWIKGLQSEGVIGDVKHYAANNQEGAPPGTLVGGSEGNRQTVNAVVDERALREIYLPQFEAAVKEGGAGSVMCAYNRLNGDYACDHRPLLTDILKTGWGFKGFVLADYGAAHPGFTGASLNAGLDFEPWPGWSYNPVGVQAALLAGQSNMGEVSEHVHRILRTLFAFGFFDRAGFRNDDSQIDKAAHARTAAEIEQAGITLLKNNGVLPLNGASLKSIAVIGADADKNERGTGSADVTPFSLTTPRQGIQTRAGPSVQFRHDPGDDPNRAAGVAKSSDVAIVVAADSSGEGTDKPCLGLACGNSNDVDRDALIEKVAAANPKTIVVLETAGPVLTPWRDRVAGLVEAWYPGLEGGSAIARVLFGDVDAAGRLPATFPKREADLATSGDPEKYPGVSQEAKYKEGVLVGYRWFDAKGIEPAFPFGFGLSYTSFRFSRLRIDHPKRSSAVARISFDVKNTGRRFGVATPELYLGLPSPGAGVAQPPKQLKGFSRVPLAPGKRRRVRLSLDQREISYWDVRSHDWRVAAGCYDVMVGASSRDIRLRGAFGRGGARCASSARRCLNRRSPIGPSHIGRVHLRRTRRALRRVPGLVSRKRRSYRWCVKGGGKVTAALSRRGRSLLVATTARGHGNRRVRPGKRVGALRRSYPRRRGFGRGLYRANPHSPRLIGVRRGRIRFIAVADRRLLRNRKKLRGYLRYAGVVPKRRKRR